MENSDGQLEILISPLSFGLAVMFPTQRAFRGRDSLLYVLTLIHSRETAAGRAALTHYNMEDVQLLSSHPVTKTLEL